MKKILLLSLSIFIFSCASLKTGGSITSVSQTQTYYLIGFNLHASGNPKPLLDSISKGIPVHFHGQEIQVLHSDTSLDINGLIAIPK